MKGGGHLGPMITLRLAAGSPSKAAPQSAGLAWTPCSPLLGDSGWGWVEGVSLLLVGSPWARPACRGWGSVSPSKVKCMGPGAGGVRRGWGVSAWSCVTLCG